MVYKWWDWWCVPCNYLNSHDRSYCNQCWAPRDLSAPTRWDLQPANRRSRKKARSASDVAEPPSTAPPPTVCARVKNTTCEWNGGNDTSEGEAAGQAPPELSLEHPIANGPAALGMEAAVASGTTAEVPVECEGAPADRPLADPPNPGDRIQDADKEPHWISGVVQKQTGAEHNILSNAGSLEGHSDNDNFSTDAAAIGDLDGDGSPSGQENELPPRMGDESKKEDKVPPLAPRTPESSQAQAATVARPRIALTTTLCDVWVYAPVNSYPVQLRCGPQISSAPTGAVLSAGEAFCTSAEERGSDGVLYLKLADGRGWAFETKPGVGTMCVRPSASEEAPPALDTAEEPPPTPEAAAPSRRCPPPRRRWRTLRAPTGAEPAPTAEEVTLPLATQRPEWSPTPPPCSAGPVQLVEEVVETPPEERPVETRSAAAPGVAVKQEGRPAEVTATPQPRPTNTAARAARSCSSSSASSSSSSSSSSSPDVPSPQRPAEFAVDVVPEGCITQSQAEFLASVPHMVRRHCALYDRDEAHYLRCGADAAQRHQLPVEQVALEVRKAFAEAKRTAVFAPPRYAIRPPRPMRSALRQPGLGRGRSRGRLSFSEDGPSVRRIVNFRSAANDLWWEETGTECATCRRRLLEKDVRLHVPVGRSQFAADEAYCQQCLPLPPPSPATSIGAFAAAGDWWQQVSHSRRRGWG